MAFRVFLDEPVGLAIGFKPELSWDNLEEVMVILDDKSSDAKAFKLPDLYEALHGDGRQLQLFAVLSTQSGKPITVWDEVIYSETGLLIWRSQEEFLAWYNDYHGQTVVDRAK